MKLALAVWKIFPSFVGGTERHSRHLATSLSALGVDVDVLCAEVPPGDDRSALPFRIVPLGWTPHLPNLASEFIFSRRVARAIRAGGYDVAYGQNLALWQYVRHREIPCVMNPHGLEPLKIGGVWARSRGWVRRRALRETASRSDAVVSLGGGLTQEVARLLRVPGRRITELPAGVDLVDVDRWRAAGSSAPRARGCFLSVGRLVANKGIEILLEAMRRLQDIRDVRLVVIGDGPLRSALAHVAPANVTFLGRVSDAELASWYAKAEALVLPSLFEGMPAVVLEAMAHRLPVVATDVGAVATMVDATNGILVRPGDVGELVGGMRALAGLGEARRREMGVRSREKVEREFTWEAVGRRTLDVLERLAASPAEAPAARPVLTDAWSRSGVTAAH